jgi:thymidine kinase
MPRVHQVVCARCGERANMEYRNMKEHPVWEPPITWGALSVVQNTKAWDLCPACVERACSPANLAVLEAASS